MHARVLGRQLMRRPARALGTVRHRAGPYGKTIYMKSIQVTFDEKLLAQLDRDQEVRRHGRSAVLRRAAAEYLRRARRSEISEAYRKAYASGADESDELNGWEGQGVWPSQ